MRFGLPGNHQRDATPLLFRCFLPIFAISAALTGQPAGAQEVIQLPSGANAQLHEVIATDAEEIRLRYVSQEFESQGADPDALLQDMTFLCETSGLVKRNTGGTPQYVVVSLANRAAPFGVLDEEVRQVFEAFTIVDDSCIWEAF